MKQVQRCIIPPYLQDHDLVAITCPAGAVNLEDMQPMISQLEAWQYKVLVGKTVGSKYHRFSAPDEERLEELQQFLDDDQIKAIFFGRGGYGLVRIIDQLDFTRFYESPKWLIGFSDITCILSHIHTQGGIVGIHAHMGAGYRPPNQDWTSTQQINEVLRGMPTYYSLHSHPFNREGTCTGRLLGGNLALLSDLIGTPSDLFTEGAILFLEDIGEPLYNIDRMLWQLSRSGKLHALAGLIIGSFTDIRDPADSLGLTLYDLVMEKVSPYNYPVCFDFPTGHQPGNLPLKIGFEYDLQVNADLVSLLDRSFV